MERDVQALAGLLILTVVASSAAIWYSISKRQSRGEALLPLEPREPVPWHAWDLAVLILVYLVLSTVGIVVATGGRADAQKVTSPQALLLAGGLAPLVWWLVAVVYLKARGASWRDMGFDFSKWTQDLAIGGATFLAAFLPVMLLQLLLVPWFPYEHPVLEMVKKQPDIQVLLLATCMAVVVAPLTEEFLFRVVLQGWAESSIDVWREALGLAPDSRPSWGPIFVSSIVFALLHLGQGAAPIPLFVLALFLGYVYRQTHRWLPCAVAHLVFNGFSMTLLWLQVRFPDALG